ncbi:hypothetical protein [Maridesulfovibrio sp.]|uniref:hypothetical protein n=1 Tax=Maridesulfovibrio sp. TaxID=2795000 RepID=UPI002A18E60A|nr:hypothetical protein [Maridesulfovibrio sp.]
MFKKTLMALCLVIALAVSAYAESPLTSDQVERVFSAFEALETYTDQMDQEREQSGEMDADPFDPEMFSRECSLMFGYNTETRKIIEDHGFTYKTWPETAGRVMKAMAYLAMQSEGESGMEEMKEALAQIEADPNMSAEQKAAMKHHLQSAMSTVNTMMKAPEEDVKAVRPYFEKYANEQ